jgi:hypothetical protein
MIMSAASTEAMLRPITNERMTSGPRQKKEKSKWACLTG